MNGLAGINRAYPCYSLRAYALLAIRITLKNPRGFHVGYFGPKS